MSAKLTLITYSLGLSYRYCALHNLDCEPIIYDGEMLLMPCAHILMVQDYSRDLTA